MSKETVTEDAVKAVDNVLTTYEGALSEILLSAVDTAGAAKDFIIGEIPDVANQILTYYGVILLLQCIVGLVLLASPFVYNKLKGDFWEANTNESEGAFHFLCILLPCALSFMTGVIMLFSGFGWIKIWLAPKLYLIEYAANLVK